MRHVAISGTSPDAAALRDRLCARGARVSTLAAEAFPPVDPIEIDRLLAGFDVKDPIDALALCSARPGGRGETATMADGLAALAAAHAVADAFVRHLIARRRPGALVLAMTPAALGYLPGLTVAEHVLDSGLAGLVHALAGNLAPHGIRANGVVAGPLAGAGADAAVLGNIPAGRAPTADEVAAGMEWLLSPAASFTTGHLLPVDGGRTTVSVPPVGGHPRARLDTRTEGAL